MTFCCKTETLMLKINTNLAVSVEELIINDKIIWQKILTEIKKEAVCTFKCLHYLQHQLRHL